MELSQSNQTFTTSHGHFALSCQTHVLGAAVIPQKVRSLRKVRAKPTSPEEGGPPTKRLCTAALTDTNEAAIAELLLGLSNSPKSCSPRESDVSTEEEEFLTVSPPKRVSKATLPSKRAHSLNLNKLKSQDMDEDYDMDNRAAPQSKATKNAKMLPGRCKCGKRVSASHPPCKSELMLLCERFCDRFGYLSANGEPTHIHLNECAVTLGVPRRRLYDITIVYEAVEVVKRTGKLAYVWRGLEHLPELIEQLKKEEELGVPVADRKGNSLLPQPTERQTTHSLWTLSRKFLRLLLTTKGPIQLTDAAEHLIGEGTTSKRQQTQVTVERRLYDIGSILATLNLIHRTYVEGKRQPAFSWNWDWRCGPLASALPKSEGTPADTLASRVPGQAVSGIGPPQLSGAPFSGARSCELPPFPGSCLNISIPQAWSLPAPTSLNFPPLGDRGAASLHSSLGRAGSAPFPGGHQAGALQLPTELPPFAPLVLPMQLLPQPPQLQCGQLAVAPFPYSLPEARPEA